MIQEDFNNITVKYLYVTRFIWQSPIEREQFQGQPLKNRIYRDIFNPLTGNHKLLIPGMDGGIGFDKLKDTNEAADFELVEITDTNILDFDIKEEDLDLINQWSETKNEDIRKNFYQDEGLNKLRSALHNHVQDEADALAHGTQALMNLWNVNPLKFDIIVDLANYLVDADLNSFEDAANYLRHHPIDGKGINISQALRALDTYVGNSRRTNENVEDLYTAIEACVTELERKIETGQID